MFYDSKYEPNYFSNNNALIGALTYTHTYTQYMSHMFVTERQKTRVGTFSM